MLNTTNSYYHHIIIDLNNLYWRSMYTCFKKSVDVENDNMYAGTIQEVIKRIKDIHESFGTADAKVYLLCDNPFSKINERQEIYPSYKHARKNKILPPAFYKTLDTLIEILKVYSNDYYIVQESNLEADDLVPVVMKQIQNDKQRFLLVSNDLDWGRGLTKENISWFNYYTLYNIESFTNEYGFSPKGKSIQMYKAIHGDESDNIPNAIPNIRKKLLTYLCTHFKTIKELTVGVHNLDISEAWKRKILDAETQLKINYQLADYIVPDNVTFESCSFTCNEKIKMLQWYYRNLGLAFEAKMITDKKEAGADFFQKKKYKRAR